MYFDKRVHHMFCSDNSTVAFLSISSPCWHSFCNWSIHPLWGWHSAWDTLYINIPEDYYFLQDWRYFKRNCIYLSHLVLLKKTQNSGRHNIAQPKKANSISLFEFTFPNQKHHKCPTKKIHQKTTRISLPSDGFCNQGTQVPTPKAL